MRLFSHEELQKGGERERDGKEATGEDVCEREIVRGERDGRDARLEQRRLLGRRRNPRLFPLGQARSGAPKGTRGPPSLSLLYICLLTTAC